MRYQGRITTWKDERGFGFITQNGDGKQIFVHIKGFVNRMRRPIGNEIVTYDLGTDPQGRPRALNVVFMDEVPDSVPLGTDPLAIAFSALFLVSLAILTALGKLSPYLLALSLGSSLLAYLFYASDKSAAQAGNWRIPERTLHFWGLIGGWPGALIAQRVLRHKCKKQEFLFYFWMTVLLNCGALAYFMTSEGTGVLNALFGLMSR